MNKFVDMASFVRVVEAGSFSEAARQLGTVKSVVSHRVQQLELHLGVVLIERGRVFRVTQLGRHYYDFCVQILRDVQGMEESIQAFDGGLHGTLRIAVPVAFVAHLAPLIAEFSLLYPKLKMDIDSDDRYVDLYQGRYDAAVRIGVLEDSTLVARSITTNRHVICGSPAYLDRKGRPESPEELREHEGLLAMRRAHHGMWRMNVEGREQSFRIRSKMRSDNADILLGATLAGVGLSIMPTFLVSAHLLAGQLEIVLPGCEPPGGDISVVYHRAQRASPKINTFVEFLLQRIGQPPAWDLQLSELLGG
ncbi:LysR family transcriptional regulator [Serratia bockelmannii]|uniref:LysR family transcriptional regulator n=1 Tax=Serratia TaxID=613 RepID=UPI0013DD85E2|nr:LysR family transcriptional regulator [Serratia marcescens]